MKVKRYVVDDLPDAVQMIRSELGSDAVILNTKEIRVGGFLGMFRKKRMEVIAAVDEAAGKPSPRPAMPARAPERTAAPTPEPLPTPLPLPPSAVREKYVQAPFADSGRKSAETAGPAPDAESSGGGRPPAAAPESGRASGPASAVPARIGFPSGPPAGTRQAAAESAAGAGTGFPVTEQSSQVLQELRSLKELMGRMTKQQTYRSMPDGVLIWSKRLAGQGVRPAYVEQFAEAVQARLAESGDPSGETAYEAARSVLTSWLRSAKGDGISPDTRIVQFVGPTGVGKTTTIAKLAADQSVGERRNVGFITADTYRIAAVDQLRTYADILNVPLEVVFSPGELARAYRKLEDRDLLFMDTAGRNYRNELFVSEVNSLLSSDERSDTILVLSMTGKFEDMKAVASRFAGYGVRQLLLTKMDETDSFGSVVNLVKEFDFRISYVTCGQAVPDDIRPFEPEELAERILGAPADD
ncbi:flagellar biosynthesis protein FlhF [Paenibacillaceae bacterium WGS1546]|uniref:flagellar biosynthesis protein FlhF n=1 Tax=Cohnella sp. WGS1546 TaxID=3366810 RepID=UPI00372D5B9C